MMDLLSNSSAVFTPDRRCRLRLERDLGTGGRVAAVIGVNPSKAGAVENDHSVRKLIGFSARLGIGRFILGNKFAHIATDVHELAGVDDPIGPGNDEALAQIFRDADLHIVAWGPLAKLPPRLRIRWRRVVAIADEVGCQLMCWGTAQDGQPRHPLTLAYATPLVAWQRPT